MSSFNRQVPLQCDAAQGSIRHATGARLAAIPAEFLLALHLSLFERFADNSQDILYRTGYEQGLQDMVRLNAEMRARYGGEAFDLWQMDAKFILESWWQPLAWAGWGNCGFDLTSAARGLVVVEFPHSPIAAALGRTEHPICHFFAGLFAGALSFYDRAERHATEIECRAAGGAKCRFVVAPGGMVDSAEGWRQQGATADEIVRRLR